MKLLIVDDEVLAIQGLLDDIPWERLHFEEILTANSYSQALNLFQTHKIDVMLSDIEMPYGSGIDLVKWVKEHYKITECIFLTCHDNFAFVKQALNLECVGYILKPADTEEVVICLKKAENKIMNASKEQMYREYGEVYIKNMTSDAISACTQDAILLVENYIHAHISEDLKLERLASISNMSITHLGRIFKKKYNMTPVDYIIRERMFLAKEMLEKKDLTISAVADKTGFNNYSYFTKTFSRYFGKTPREYQQECWKNKA